MLFWALFVACSGGASPALQAAQEAERVEVERAAVRKAARVEKVEPAEAAAVAPPAAGEPVEVVLVWDGISPLHQSFFVDSDAVKQLGKDLAGRVQPPANIHISFDSERHIGRILLRLLPDTGVGLIGPGETEMDLNRISPVLQALARYRSHVASRYDTRVQAFKIGIEAFRGTLYCRFGAAGTPPPDGTVIDPCVLLNGVSTCGQAHGSTVRFDPSVVDTLKACLR